MALYCAGFAGYARALLPWHTPEWSGKAIGIGLIVAVVVVNLIGTKFVGKSEIFVITIELAILAAFVYGTVSLGHLRVYRETGAKPWLLVLAVALNLALFALPLGYTIHTGPASTWITLLAVLVLSFVFEVVYRRRTGRSLALESTAT